jgi:uncharacterized protein with FMN-binding domain
VTAANGPGRRNAGIVAASAAALGLLMLYPTSTNGGTSHRRPGQPLAPVGIVTPSASASPPASAGASRPAAAPVTTTVNGRSVDTQYGPVQVQIKVRGGRIVHASAIDYPQSGGRDREINSYAVPILERETVRTQGAHVDTVSGATYTSEGYQSSLQAALDAAHLG